MKKALRYVLIGIGVIIVLVGGFAAFVAIRGIPDYTPQTLALNVKSSPERIERGRQLSAMLCNDCHMDPNTGKLTGKKMEEAAMFGDIYSKKHYTRCRLWYRQMDRRTAGLPAENRCNTQRKIPAGDGQAAPHVGRRPAARVSIRPVS